MQTTSRSRHHGEPAAQVGPWQAAWILCLPLGVWLAATKFVKVVYTAAVWTGAGPADYRPLSLLHWFGVYAWSRFAAALLIAWVVQRIVAPRRPALVAVLFLGQIVGLAALRAFAHPDLSVGGLLDTWFLHLAQELRIVVASLWREGVTVALFVLSVGTLLRLVQPASRPRWVAAVQIAIVALCLLTGIDLVYEFGTGQSASAAVLMFFSSNLRDIAPLIAAETTAWRVIAVIGGPAIAVAWMVHERRLAKRIALGHANARRGLVGAAVLSLAVFLPVVSADSLPYERYDEGTLIGFSRTLLSSASREAAATVAGEFEAENRPRWYSADMRWVPTDHAHRYNVVIIMLESVRAVSTTMHSPALETTPYLNRLASQGFWVQDMSAVVPRTAGAWMAVLGGQYPLTNEGTRTWSVVNIRQPRVRGLPTVLRQLGYATGFFVPTHLGLLNEIEVVRALGFETIVAERELMRPGIERVNYMGLADEVMVDPILDWTAAQAGAGRPFMLAVMTNIGHHPYETPKGWPTVHFEGVTDPRLQGYLNCLRYVDGIVERLMTGLQRQGRLDDTIVIVLGDHGQFFGEHGVKQTFNALYEEGLQVPAIMLVPGGPAPRIIAGPRQQIDILPTIADLLGMRVQGARLPGVSLLAPPDPERRLFYSSSIESSYLALRQGSRKYIFSHGRAPMEIFDLADDPREAHPLQDAGDAELVDVRRELLEWKGAAELSMFARPADPAKPAGAWVRQ